MNPRNAKSRRGTVLFMVVGLLAMLFIVVSAYIVLAKFERDALRESQRGHINERIVDTTIDYVLSTVRKQWESPTGGHYGGGLITYEDRPGAGGSKFISSPEPVRDRMIDPAALGLRPYPYTPGALPAGQEDLDRYRYPGYTQLSDVSLPGATFGPTILTMMMDYADPGQTTPLYTQSDVIANARRPFMDANGDGIPDSYFPAMKHVTEMGNAMAGVSVGVQPYNPPTAQPPIVNTLVPLASGNVRFDQQARNEVAVMVLPHGGMLDLSAGANLNANGVAHANSSWMRPFVTNTFNYIRHPNDGATLNPTSGAHQNLLNALAQESSAVEARLRYRGSLIVPVEPQASPQAEYSTIPDSLRDFQSIFRYTALHNYPGPAAQYGKPNNWGMFNLARAGSFNNAGDGAAYLKAAYLDPGEFNDTLGSSGGDPRPYYHRRQLLTTRNTSDENARVQSPLPPGGGTGLYAGQSKFNLHSIANINPMTGPLGAFWAPGDAGAYADYVPSRADFSGGTRLISELVNYYTDMLSGYDGFTNDATITESLSDAQQAIHLAVNTVAFAAPRDPGPTRPGYVDLVVYTPDPVNQPTERYVGYGPQPFITQVIAARDATNALEVGIELYNPNDRQPGTTPDAHALYLPQFAISFNEDYEGPAAARTWNTANLFVLNAVTASGLPIHPTSGQPYMSGRSFQTLIVAGGTGGGSVIAAGMPSGNGLPTPGLIGVPIVPGPGGNGRITVKLWRGSLTQTRPEATTPQFLWVLVDQMEVEDPAQGLVGADPPFQGSYTSAYRDTATETYWTADTNVPPAFPRWRCATGAPHTDPAHPLEQAEIYPPNLRADDIDVSGAISGLNFGAEGPVFNARYGPTTPLYLMNGATGIHVINGASRPVSFPTVGFLAFVPRFAHYEISSGLGFGDSLIPMTRALYNQFAARDSTFAWPPAGGRRFVPADFGHLPLFDNTQQTPGDGSSYFDDANAGRVPWGQLVFDYFTTLDPKDPNGDTLTDDELDPSRVRGRININEASWLMLASLPVLGPNPANWIMPFSPSVSPAFRDPASRMFVSPLVSTTPPPDPTSRFDGGLFEYDATAGWRLGPYLAQSLAGYRDRAQNIPAQPAPGSTAYAGSHNRNSMNADPGGQLWSPYREGVNIYGEVRRGGVGTAPEQTGLVSIGEIANVKGFDQTNYTFWAGALAPEVLNWSPATPQNTFQGDFMKAAALTALLDSQFLTTRSNTFTVYVTVADRVNPQASIRSQVTIDRGNIVPKTVMVPLAPGVFRPTIVENTGLPEMVTEREVAYFNVRYDD